MRPIVRRGDYFADTMLIRSLHRRLVLDRHPSRPLLQPLAHALVVVVLHHQAVADKGGHPTTWAEFDRGRRDQALVLLYEILRRRPSRLRAIIDPIYHAHARGLMRLGEALENDGHPGRALGGLLCAAMATVLVAPDRAHEPLKRIYRELELRFERKMT
jgi:hypothetical protein